MPKIEIKVVQDDVEKVEYADIPEAVYKLVRKHAMTFRGEVYGEGSEIGAIYGKFKGEDDKDEVIEDFVNKAHPKEGTSPMQALCKVVKVLAERRGDEVAQG